jgi:hypothetical protein
MRPLLYFHWENLPEAQVCRQIRHRHAVQELAQAKIAKVEVVWRRKNLIAVAGQMLQHHAFPALELFDKVNNITFQLIF